MTGANLYQKLRYIFLIKVLRAARFVVGLAGAPGAALLVSVPGRVRAGRLLGG